MANGYRILWEGGEGELIEKKSRFIATTQPASTEEEAAAFVERMRKKYWDARHHCYAYVLGEQGRVQKCSDDGEPAQTAGRPMLDVLLGDGVRDICVVVTRYFGGVLLGTGGLVRAYSAAVTEGLKHSKIIEKCPGRQVEILTDYADLGRVQYILSRMQLAVMDTRYTDRTEISVMAPEDEVGELIARVTEGTAGRAQITASDPVSFGVADGKVVLLSRPDFCILPKS